MLFWSNPSANRELNLWKCYPRRPFFVLLIILNVDFRVRLSVTRIVPTGLWFCCAWTLSRMLLTAAGFCAYVHTCPQKSYKQLTPAGCTSSIVNVRMNTAENPIRAVLRSSGVAPCHPFSPFLNVVPFALFLWVQTELFPLGPNVLSLIGDLPWQSVLAHIKRKR